MKIILIGSTGTIGRKLKERLERKHELITANRHSGTFTVDMTDAASILKLFRQTGKVDAVVCTAGEAKWAPFNQLSEADYYIGIRDKLMGQVNLVRIGKDFLKEGGSLTLTTGILADEPERMTASASMVNGAIHSFIKAVALELRSIRVNAVCADVVEDAYEKYRDYFPGHTPVPMNKVVDGYVRSIEGLISGQVIRIMA